MDISRAESVFVTAVRLSGKRYPPPHGRHRRVRRRAGPGVHAPQTAGTARSHYGMPFAARCNAAEASSMNLLRHERRRPHTPARADRCAPRQKRKSRWQPAMSAATTMTNPSASPKATVPALSTVSNARSAHWRRSAHAADAASSATARKATASSTVARTAPAMPAWSASSTASERSLRGRTIAKTAAFPGFHTTVH